MPSVMFAHVAKSVTSSWLSVQSHTVRWISIQPPPAAVSQYADSGASGPLPSRSTVYTPAASPGSSVASSWQLAASRHAFASQIFASPVHCELNRHSTQVIVSGSQVGEGAAQSASVVQPTAGASVTAACLLEHATSTAATHQIRTNRSYLGECRSARRRFFPQDPCHNRPTRCPASPSRSTANRA
jgi:hypothetical protein